jgi:hypothetical protein
LLLGEGDDCLLDASLRQELSYLLASPFEFAEGGEEFVDGGVGGQLDAHI